MADKTGGDWLDNLVNELVPQNTNAAADTVGVQPTDTSPLVTSEINDMTIESAQDDKVASTDLIDGNLVRQLNFTDMTMKSDSPAVGKRLILMWKKLILIMVP